MAGAVQTAYPRKNCSSLMLFSCDHKYTQHGRANFGFGTL